ncbi:MAG: flagellar hook-associated protein 3, partial [Betaproteobacteria bacterium]|nr:flagellar hook-associated protein 3 [Betaproteobacteria bacterium]
MVMKVSTSMFFDKASKQLGNVQGGLAKTQEQLSTGKQINKPSDEPDKASLITRLESEMARQKSYQSNLKSVNIRLQAEETALKNTSDVMFRFKELAVQAGNDTLSTADRRTISLEMVQLRDQILSLANSQDSNGNFLFAGSRVGQAPFGQDAKGRVVYQGDQSRMVVPVGDNRRMNLNIPGSDAFVHLVRDDGKGRKIGVGFFQALSDMVDAVATSARPNIQRGIKELDRMQQGISDANAQVGTDMNVIDSQNSVLDEI